jgi:3-mercaptopyruvate sulfurtransferase SseA
VPRGSGGRRRGFALAGGRLWSKRYEQGHIPGARFVDWTVDIVGPRHRFAFMLAPPDERQR